MKKGFTLIELMVVIVIIGILAAIAVPKMFGMSAKAKAAEVGPAAGSWSKLQAAYITEVAETGSFISISYMPPGASSSTTTSSTTNFNYTNPTPGSITQGDWQASARIRMNNCAANSNWGATMNTSAIPTATAPGTGCTELTPNFTKLQ